MEHFARIDENNIVQSVYLVDNENLFNEHGKELSLVGEVLVLLGCKQDNNISGKNYAGVGYTYDKTNDVFIPPQPFPSWTLDASFDWQPPTPMPDDDKIYNWNEDTTTWDEPEQ